MMKNTLTIENCSIKRVCVERSDEKIDHQLGSGNRKDTITQVQKKNNTRNQWNFISLPLTQLIQKLIQNLYTIRIH